jgi:cytochrome c5
MKSISIAAICGMAAVFLLDANANHNTPESLEARVAAVGSLNIGGTAMAAASGETAAPEDGETVYNTTCATCHGSGVAGAPILGEMGDWEDRIETGFDALADHAIQGYTGESGVMPPKGGNAALSDSAVTAAVQYMVDQVQ